MGRNSLGPLKGGQEGLLFAEIIQYTAQALDHHSLELEAGVRAGNQGVVSRQERIDGRQQSGRLFFQNAIYLNRRVEKQCVCHRHASLHDPL